MPLHPLRLKSTLEREVSTASIISWSPDLHRWGIFFPDSLILASSLKEVAHEWTGDQCRELLKKLQVPQGGVVSELGLIALERREIDEVCMRSQAYDNNTQHVVKFGFIFKLATTQVPIWFLYPIRQSTVALLR